LNIPFSSWIYRADFFIVNRGVYKVFIYNKIINGYDFKLSLFDLNKKM
jgi:hypothetical protein